ncbi:hypothetical protein [Pengzhenrongella sp.]|jgi:hypothetical protein|uniref:hypothetical protein n=1 Tax=Pengzhenrongella sp. TaxID=2888820 RepID=UPI002F92A634
MDNREIDEHLVRSLLREQRPDLAGLSLRQVVGGWHNRLWRCACNTLSDLAIDGVAGEVRDLWDDAVAAPAWAGPPTRLAAR